MPVQAPEATMAPGTGSLASSGSRRAMAGFFLSGVLLGFLGAILLSWGHHLSVDYDTVALYFGGLIVGLLGSVWASPRLLESRGMAWTLAFSCGLAGLGFVYLAFVSPPYSAWWRVGGMAVIGAAAGLLHTAVFNAVSPMYRHNPIATVNLAGMLFGLGCLTDAILISGTYFFYSAAAIQAWIAVIPAAFGWMFWRSPFHGRPVALQPAPGAFLKTLRNPGAVILSLLLLFQCGNEWAVAGWLPLFLTQRLGLSPSTALWMLGLYWAALTIGRVAAQWLLPHVRHSRLLLGCVVLSLFGSMVLSATNNRFGAISAILMLGCAFAPIYPLVVEKIGFSFPSYHPGLYNGLFSVALAAGLVAPAILGLAAKQWGVSIVMTLPIIGTLAVCLLLMLLWLEARLSAHARRGRVA